ncbi:hypothetical protein RFI_39472 [Reticulomyxa filosa]|uniref:Uncharacterized protein n=1 Tax=Reticulomyxa filosa TaxID=46433 RepID=X6L7Z2_RETFI|nr:hypothetical protein RFI_39472 [Reticulomyxa filosa]|eukprot:ETN98047.1 hypothetical protein RFI_39472 [Reticulomyxa filosa]
MEKKGKKDAMTSEALKRKVVHSPTKNLKQKKKQQKKTQKWTTHKQYVFTTKKADKSTNNKKMQLLKIFFMSLFFLSLDLYFFFIRRTHKNTKTYTLQIDNTINLRKLSHNNNKKDKEKEELKKRKFTRGHKDVYLFM